MSRRARSPRLWIPVSCFLAAAVLVPLTCRWRQQQRRPRTLADLVTRAESRLGLHPVAAAQFGDPNAGVYLCRQDGRARTDLPQSRQRVFLDAWQGVVLLVPLPSTDEMLREKLEEWGDAAAVIGNVLLFGDPSLVAEIVRLVEH